MATYRHELPQLGHTVFIIDAGIEAALTGDEGIALTDDAAFPLLTTAQGWAALERYYRRYTTLAASHQVGLILETATWRTSPDWGARLGYQIDDLVKANQQAVELVAQIRSQAQLDTPMVISGSVGPRSGTHDPSQHMTVAAARTYHAIQINALADSEADMIGATAMTSTSEAIGVTLAARNADMPIAISFIVEPDGTLPGGDSLDHAINAVDNATSSHPAYYMIDCAHPALLNQPRFPTQQLTPRLRGIRVGTTSPSNTADGALGLDGPDPALLASLYVELRKRLPNLTVLGGCWGTHPSYSEAIARAINNETREATSAPSSAPSRPYSPGSSRAD